MHGRLRRTADQIDNMTMGELELALDDDTDKRRGPEGFKAMSQAEMMLAAQARREMSLAQKIRRAKEQR